MDLLVVTFHIMLKFVCKYIFKVLFPLIVFLLDAVNFYVGGTPQHIISLCVVIVIKAIHKGSFTWIKSAWSNVTE